MKITTKEVALGLLIGGTGSVTAAAFLTMSVGGAFGVLGVIMCFAGLVAMAEPND